MFLRTLSDDLRARIDALPPIVAQFAAYGTIGAFTTSFDVALFAVLVTTFGWREGALPTVAATVSYMVAALIAYVLNSRIAFRAQHQGDSVATFVRFALTFGSSAALAAAIFWTAQALLGSSTLALLAAKGAVILAIIVWNFTLLRLWVFRAHAAPIALQGDAADAR